MWGGRPRGAWPESRHFSRCYAQWPSHRGNIGIFGGDADQFRSPEQPGEDPEVQLIAVTHSCRRRVVTSRAAPHEYATVNKCVDFEMSGFQYRAPGSLGGVCFSQSCWLVSTEKLSESLHFKNQSTASKIDNCMGLSNYSI